MLQDLRVLHLHKTASAGPVPELRVQGGFFLETCQRAIWVFLGGEAEFSLPALPVLRGVEAYSFLVRFSAGLESAVVGETDVFGQVKEAWQKQARDLAPELEKIFPKIFEDAKEIRSSYLEHLGGLSYGSLVRKYMKASDSGVTLLVGAGQLARSVAPFLTGEIWISNRNVKNAEALASEFPGIHFKILRTPEEETEAFRRADRVVLCVPADAERDPARAKSWGESSRQGRTLVHLGVERAQSGEWKTLDQAHFLDDLFEFQKSQGQVRSLKIAQAERACDERAKLRSLGASVGVHHGWEDLALFA